MQVHQLLAYRSHMVKPFTVCGSFDMRQHLFQISCIRLPIVRVMKDAVDVVENIITGDIRSQCSSVFLSNGIGNIVHAAITINDLSDLAVHTKLTRRFSSGKQIKFSFWSFNWLPLETSKKLACQQGMEVRQYRCGQWHSDHSFTGTCCHKADVGVYRRREQRWELVTAFIE